MKTQVARNHAAHEKQGVPAGWTKLYRGTDRKALQALLRDHGFRSTEGRLNLLAVLKAAHRPMAVPEACRMVGGALDMVNVYRALEALTGAGILTRTDLRKGGAHYEFLHEGHHHHHITCTDCGTTEDVEGCEDAAIESKVLRRSRSFSTVESHALEFFGTCSRCAKRSLLQEA